MTSKLCREQGMTRHLKFPEGGNSLSRPYRYVQPQRVQFSAVLVINRADVS